MRGSDRTQGSMFSYVDLEHRIPEKHPIRRIRRVVDKALKDLEATFGEMYSRTGRPSIPPEQLIRALLLQIVYSIRSERQLMERIDYDLLFRWFVGLGIDDRVWDATVFTKNRDRLMRHDIDEQFLRAVTRQGYAKKLLSRDHFSVDGTLIEACASLKSFKPKEATDDDDDENFHGQKRSNDTHQSTTDPDARLFRKGLGKEAKLNHMGHIVTENRSGFIVETEVTPSGMRQEWVAGIEMLKRQTRSRRQTVAADKGYDTGYFVLGCRELSITPHVAAKRAQSRLDARTTRHESYAISQRCRKRVEEPFGWMKRVGLMHKLRHRGRPKVSWIFRFTAATYNVMLLQATQA